MPENLHDAIVIGIDRALRDLGADVTGCTPSMLTGHVIQELKQIPGWRPPADPNTTAALELAAAGQLIQAGWRPTARVIENQAQLSGWPIGTVIRDAQDRIARRTRMGDGPAWIALGVAPGSYRPVALPAAVLWTPEEAQR